MNNASIYKMDKGNYELILRSFDIEKCTLAIKSVLFNHSPGDVYVDSVISPKTAFVWNNEHNFFVLGDLDNKEYNEQLSKVIHEDIIKKVKQKDNLLDYYIRFFQNNLSYTGKYEEMISVLFKENPVMISKYRYYSLDLSEYEIKKWGDILLDSGINIEFIDSNFLKKTHLDNYEQIIGMINENWISEKVFLKEGFGFCLVKNDSIISWCISDYNIDKQCEIGVETDDKYWRKGYATIVVTEVLNYCKQRGLKKVGWHCRDNNIGSYKLAEKVGFKRMDDYHTYHAWFNVFDNFLVNGHYYLTQTEEYRKAAECYEKAFDMRLNNSSDYLNSVIFSESDNIKWCYYNTACAWALSGECERAFSSLQEAVKAGWKNINMLKNDERLQSLRTNSRWVGIINVLA